MRALQSDLHRTRLKRILGAYPDSVSFIRSIQLLVRVAEHKDTCLRLASPRRVEVGAERDREEQQAVVELPPPRTPTVTTCSSPSQSHASVRQAPAAMDHAVTSLCLRAMRYRGSCSPPTVPRVLGPGSDCGDCHGHAKDTFLSALCVHSVLPQPSGGRCEGRMVTRT